MKDKNGQFLFHKNDFQKNYDLQSLNNLFWLEELRIYKYFSSVF